MSGQPIEEGREPGQDLESNSDTCRVRKRVKLTNVLGGAWTHMARSWGKSMRAGSHPRAECTTFVRKNRRIN